MNLDEITCPKRSERLVRLHRITNKWNWPLQLVSPKGAFSKANQPWGRCWLAAATAAIFNDSCSTLADSMLCNFSGQEQADGVPTIPLNYACSQVILKVQETSCLRWKSQPHLFTTTKQISYSQSNAWLVGQSDHGLSVLNGFCSKVLKQINLLKPQISSFSHGPYQAKGWKAKWWKSCSYSKQLATKAARKIR